MAKRDNPDVEAYLRKSDQAFQEMETLKANNLFAGAVVRGYYAIFNAACAMLSSIGLTFSKHSAVIAFFGKEFVKSRKVHPDFHLILREAYELRRDAEYDIYSEIDEAAVKIMQGFATKFREMAKTYLSETAGQAEKS